MEPGRRLGDFVLQGKLASGGGGDIYLADQRLLGREVVIKVLQNAERDSAAAREHFAHEAQLASKLDHPFAAHVYAFGIEDDGLYWIAMERVQGITLRAFLEQRGPIPLARFVPLLERICDVVHTAHEAGIVHRDLKDANVMVVSRAGKLLPKLLDFGIAKEGSTRSGGEELTEAPVDTLNTRYLGSPHYMAPEQWVAAADVTSRVDIYALGVLSYQCLTGKLPFTGTLRALARAHAGQPLRRPDGPMPEEVFQALVRATAKRPQDRFDTCLAFAAAVRGGSTQEREEHRLPALAEDLRGTLLTEAPQPIADAVSLMDAATSLRQLNAAIHNTVVCVVRYLGLLSLAARVRVGSGAELDSPAVQELLQRLRGQELPLADWLMLAEHLCRRFFGLRDAHPMPELVDFFAVGGGDSSTSALALLRGLASASEPEGAAAEDEARVRATLASLSQVLASLGFLFDYPLVERSSAGLLQWMGVGGRARRLMACSNDLPLDLGQLGVLDAGGGLALPLWPLGQVMSPAPGAPPELFMLTGEGRHGARLVCYPQGFQRQDAALWDWLSQRVAFPGAISTTQREELRRPYLGLASFSASEAANFFGRELEAEEVANRLRLNRLLAVVGPSGAGKTSFVQAGVLPLVASEWRTVTTRPGSAPLDALVSRLAEAGIPGLTVDALRARPALAAEALQRGQAGLVLVFDQFEELITLCANEGEREALAAVLVAIADSDVNARVVLTLRDDFLVRVQQIPSFRRRLNQSLQLLGTPARDDLLRIVTEPARRAGYAFEDLGLPAEMVDAVVAQPGALALLSFTASKLWELRDRHVQRLTRRAYQSLGGVGGALAHHAEALLAELAPEEQRLVREVFRAVVTAEGTRAVIRRAELEEILGGGRAAATVVEKLVAGRLLVTSEQPGGEDRIEVIHETLLVSWPRLVRWQREDAENARLRDQLRSAARQWDERGRPRGVLWRGEALTEYRLWRSRYVGALTGAERAFAEASLREEARGRRRTRAVLAAILMSLVAGLVVLFRANRRAEAGEANAHQQLALSHLDQGRLFALSSRPIQALAYLSRAVEEGLWTPGLRYLIARASTQMSGQRMDFDALSAKIFWVALSPDRRLIASGRSDGSVQVWEAATGRLTWNWAESSASVWFVAFDREGKRVIGMGGGDAHVWDVESGARLATLPVAGAWAAFMGDGSLLTLADVELVRWDGATFQERGRLHLEDDSRGAALDPKAERLALYAGHDPARFSGARSGIVVVDTRGLTVLGSLQGHSSGVLNAAFSPDGKMLASGSMDGTARLWDVEALKPLHVLTGHEGPVARVAWSPMGKTLATAGDDGTARIWDVAAATSLLTLRGHEGGIEHAAFLEQGDRLATAGSDASVGVWDTASGRSVMVHAGHLNSITSLLEGPAADEIVTGSADGSIRTWNARLNASEALTPPGSHLSRAGLAGHDYLLTADAERAWTAWDLERGVAVKRFTGLGRSPLLRFSPRLTRAIRSETAQERLSLVEVETGAARDLMETTDAVCWAPDEQTFAASEGSALWLRRIDQPAPLRVFKNTAEKGATRCAFSADGGRLIAGNRDGSATIWDVGTGRILSRLVGHTAAVWTVGFSADGRRALTGGYDERAILWDAATGTLVQRFDCRHGSVSAVSLDASGDLLAAQSSGWGVDLFEAAPPGRLLQTFRDPTVLGSAFSHDGAFLFIASRDGLRRWPTSIERRDPATVLSDAKCRLPLIVQGDGLVPNTVRGCTAASLR